MVGLVVGLIAGIILFKFMKGNDGMSLMENQLRSIQDEKESLSAKTERLEKELGVLQVDASGLEKDLTYSREILAQKEEDIQRIKLEFKERKEAFQTEIVETKTQLQKEFQLLANSILEDKGKRFTEINNDKIGSLIKPLQKDIEQFKKRVDEVYGQEQKERGSLENHLNQLLTLNKELNEGAKNLTKALKGDSKSQGDWGELQLEVISESGLRFKMNTFVEPCFFQDDLKL